MKTLTALTTLILLPILLFCQVDVWIPVVSDGFGNTNNIQLNELHEFKGKLFATTSCRPSDMAELWYSSTGDPGSWNQVVSFSPPLDSSIKCLPSLSSTDLNGGIMYLGGGNTFVGSIIYRSTDGINWTKISPAGFGLPRLYTVSPNMTVFQGTADTIPYLYAGLGAWDDSDNAQLWRIPYNSTNPSQWQKLIDFDTVATTITDSVELISYFQTWNNKLYFSTSGKGQLWESSDGINFTQNTGVGYGFGVFSNHVIACLQVFNDTLFASTTNIVLGGQMYRTGDGITWDTVTTDAFGDGSASEELHNFDVGFGYLWITAYTDTTISNGSPIWRSSDGWLFVQSNADGFGDINNNGPNAVTSNFGNYQYFGGPNYTNGAQIWRANMTTNINSSDCSVMIAPNPIRDIAQIKFEIKCPEIIQFDIYNISGVLIKTTPSQPMSQISIDKGLMQPGLYIYKIILKNGEINTGKLIIE